MFGGFCLLFLPCLWGDSPSSLCGCGFFDASLFGVFLSGQIFLIRILPGFLPGGFCLESLILAQDERWRRA